MEAQISITQVQYWGNFLIIVLENEDTDLTAVPRTTTDTRPTSTRRLTDPTGDVVNNSRFPYGDKVFLPCASGNEIAQISMEITHRNVVIAKWEKGAGYRWSDSIGYGH
ncbi:unnamed protein product [Penicillium camemberti]|uniref:Str. FM013 n=1 Tax=Penicillium camemberti (strain FM 013) TaxID=1429867 RepID=A0A0G4NZ25_PENC3|nr:unnamed protein product [Penicillium camemberti]